MLEIEEVLWILSASAIVTTIALFFCGIPICMEIYRRKSTDEISGVPFLMGVLGGVFWLRYGLLKLDMTMITVNVVGVSLFSCYLFFYYIFTKSKFWLTVQIATVLSMIASMVLFVIVYSEAAMDPLGFACMTFNIVNFGAPLAGLRVVLRKRCCDSLPLPMCTANLLVSAQWFTYGYLVDDIYIIIPNGCGMGLALIQLSLFIIFPMQVDGISPVGRIARCCLAKATTEVQEDPEKNSPMDKEMAKRMAALGELLRKYSTPAKNFVHQEHSPHKVYRSGSFDSQMVSSTSSGSSTFTRITEVDELEKEWKERELKARTQSAPHLAEL